MQVEIKGYIVFGQHDYEQRCGEKPYFTFKDYEPSEGFVTVREHEITVDVPDEFDPRPQMVEKLEAEKKRIEAEFYAKITQINGQIQSLLAIEA